MKGSEDVGQERREREKRKYLMESLEKQEKRERQLEPKWSKWEKGKCRLELKGISFSPHMVADDGF